MKVTPKEIRYSFHLLLQLQRRTVTKSQDGYAMLVTSILAILMFSMLSVYLFSANLYRSVANTVVDSGTTFFAAESGMNQRANIARAKFEGFSQPTGSSPSGDDVVAQMQQCINNRGAADNANTVGTGDLRCIDTVFNYRESQWKSLGGNGFADSKGEDPDIKYRAYSFIRQLTGATEPAITQIPAGEPFAGLNMQEYQYRVYATAQKESAGALPISAQTLLQMDFNSRVVPLFQFAAFYEQDLEITSSSNMSLNGPIHSNSNVWLAPGGTLTAGQTTAARRRNTAGNWIGGKIYKSLNRLATYSGLNPGYRFILGSNTPIDVSGAWSAANTQVTATEITASNGLLRPEAPRLEIPPVGFLSRTDSTGRVGTYFDKADLRVNFDPNRVDAANNGQPFGIQSIQGGVTTNFSAGMTRSLRQPVMVVTQAHGTENKAVSLNTIEWQRLCTDQNYNFASTALANTLNPANLASVTLTLSEANEVSNALRRVIAKSPTFLTYQQMNSTAISGLGTFNTSLQTEINAISNALLSSTKKASLIARFGTATPRDIANKAGNCFLPAPMQVLSNQAGSDGPAQTDRQEARSMNFLQSNIHSLTIWNRDGMYSNDNVNVLNATSTVFARKPDINGAVANGVSASTIPVGSYEWMGLAASDTTQRGLVWHFSVNGAATYNHAAGQSPYGFVFSGGRVLPGPLTLASDQLVYVQGDVNNPGGVQPATSGEDVFAGATGAENLRHKEPAAVMADAIGVLSNSCENANGQVNCFNIANGSPLVVATPTTVNAAFLAGTVNESGLNNYFRMMENWGGTNGIIFRYRGSFISLGTPQKLNGIYRPSSSTNATATSYYVIPSRDFGFDASFNSVSGLPPLAPQVVYLKQRVFKRDYESDRTK